MGCGCGNKLEDIDPLVGELREVEPLKGILVGEFLRGYSAYKIAQINGFTGTEQEWLLSLKGEKGDKGDPGDVGPKGDKGDKGDTGEQGSKGDQGIQGDKGDKGDTGERGLQGEKGDKGDKGDTPVITSSKENGVTTVTSGGVTIAVLHDGEKGDKGDQGDRGLQGDKGDKGEKGDTPVIASSKENGVTTVTSDGVTIAVLLDGAKGDKGDQGEKGNTGEQGLKGDKGEKGDTPSITAIKTNEVTTLFSDGTQIAVINDGQKGDKGDTGEKGLQGDKGDKGDTPVITAIKNDNVTAVFADGTQIATILDGTKGDKGDTGEQGIQGLKGDAPVITASESGKVTTIYADGTPIAMINDGSDGEDYTLTAADKQDIASLVVGMEIDDTAGDGDTDKTWSADKIVDELANAGTVKDVTVDGTSIVNMNGEAVIPIASTYQYGMIKIGTGLTTNTSTGLLTTTPATEENIKAGAFLYTSVSSLRQHMSVFYGLAKASGDTTQSQSNNPVGTYTEEAKTAIKAMLGVEKVVNVTGISPVIVAEENVRYICGEILSLNFTPSSTGVCDVRFTSGSTVTVLTIPSTVKMPDWFDASSLAANVTYEINVLDGVYGVVASLAV